MLPRSRTIVFVLAITCFIPFLAGQTREVSHSKKRTCTVRYNGPGNEPLNGSSWSCGTKGYTRVFTGTVRSAVDVSDTETRLELVPDEAFLGDTSELTATINQACLSEYEPEIQAGDKWLLYVRPKRYWDSKTLLIDTDGLEVPWDSPSKPMSEGEDDVASLRHLAELTDTGILTGNVVRIGPTFVKAVYSVPDCTLFAITLWFGTGVGFNASMLKALQSQIDEQLPKLVASGSPTCQSSLTLEITGDPDMQCFVDAPVLNNKTDQTKGVSLETALARLGFQNLFSASHVPPKITLNFARKCQFPTPPYLYGSAHKK